MDNENNDQRQLTPEQETALELALPPVSPANLDEMPSPREAGVVGFIAGLEFARGSSPAPDAERIERELGRKLQDLLSSDRWCNDPIGRREVVALVLAAVASSPVPAGDGVVSVKPTPAKDVRRGDRFWNGREWELILSDPETFVHEATSHTLVRMELEKSVASCASFDADENFLILVGASPVSVGDEDYCGAQDWYRNEDGEVVIDGTCGMPVGHDGNKHHDFSKGEVWHAWHGPADRRAPEDEPMDRCDCNIPYLEGAGQHSPGCSVFKTDGGGERG